jgi:hypothetical protein
MVRVAQWIARLPPKQKVAGSNPASDVDVLCVCRFAFFGSLRHRGMEQTDDMIGTAARMSSQGDWSSGMIPALGAGGREFDSRITPFPPGANGSGT